jgi:hypothetical protein
VGGPCDRHPVLVPAASADDHGPSWKTSADGFTEQCAYRPDQAIMLLPVRFGARIGRRHPSETDYFSGRRARLG